MTKVQKPKLAEAGGPTIAFRVHFRNGNRGQRRLCLGTRPTPTPIEPGSIPRIAKLMALAIRFDGLLREGVVGSYGELARFGHVTRPRICQVMGLLDLAPDLQEALLFLPRTQTGGDPITERQIRPIVALPDWRQQRSLWRSMVNRCYVTALDTGKAIAT